MSEKIDTNIRKEKKELPPKSVAIFDFDGTISDSGEVVANILNELADEYGYPKLSREDIAIYTNKSARRFIREDLKMSWLRLPGFAKRVRAELNKRLPSLKPIGGMVEVVKELKSRGYRIGIVSSNSEKNIRQFLANNDIDIFDFVSSGSSIFGKGRNIGKVLMREGFRQEDVVYIGDEIRDSDAAKKVGIDVIVVSWGYNSRESLENNDTGILVDSPNQLLDLLPPKSPTPNNTERRILS